MYLLKNSLINNQLSILTTVEDCIQSFRVRVALYIIKILKEIGIIDNIYDEKDYYYDVDL